MPVPKRPLARSSLLALLAVLSLSVLSTSSSALPTPNDHNNAAAAIDPIPIIQKRSPDDTAPSGTDAGSIVHHAPHTPYGYPNQSPGGGLETGESRKRDLLKRGLIPFFGQREGESSDDDISSNSGKNLDSDEQSFMYDKESRERDYYWENLRLEAEDMDYEIDDDDRVVIEPLYYSKDLFEDDGEEQEEDVFGAGEGIVDENSDDDYNNSPWHGYRRQSQKGLGLSAPSQDSTDVDVTAGGDNIWIVDDWEEDLEGTEEMMDELVDWIEDLEHTHSHPGSSSVHDRRYRQGHNNNADGSEGNLRARPLHRLFSNPWTI
ncbi:hypothetical protein BGX26_009904 [Mortierella sp. AD094]|nr:hypothetical protein BGX26_009904 [Mortierella sp. AD094]